MIDLWKYISEPELTVPKKRKNRNKKNPVLVLQNEITNSLVRRPSIIIIPLFGCVSAGCRTEDWLLRASENWCKMRHRNHTPHRYVGAGILLLPHPALWTARPVISVQDYQRIQAPKKVFSPFRLNTYLFYAQVRFHTEGTGQVFRRLLISTFVL